ncbi:MAG TPA: FAD-dependent oxidoreductase [Actinocrinis sp.]|uniref:NAD(P)/FAD-dependent oxidoreductase n=1 Tax=Actinocrinis sp. TaxID=1920516 RepID=UPI002DDCD2A7|nr:FAD-dependent oxidoreductase [Actinocrinis sp.]HEV3173024.1 FAD-dependent oxidoreductase [Actinocrinis sp.]
MTAAPIVIVGGGQAGLQTAASLRDQGYSGPVTLVCGEPAAPYERPPLSKQFLAGQCTLEDTALRAPDFYPEQEIDLRLGDPAVRIYRSDRTVLLESGARLPYQRLVLALGSRPRPLPVPGANHPGVLALRTLADAEALRARLSDSRRVVVIGAGFTGLEVAAAAASAGLEVTVVESFDRVIARAVSPAVSEYLTALHTGNGVRILTRRTVEAVEAGTPGGYKVRLSDGESIPADLVVAAVGVLPETALAEQAGLEVANGIVVDRYLCTADPAIYAVGDCVSFPTRHTAGLVRLESVQNATDQAQRAAANLAVPEADRTPYGELPWFWTDQYQDKVQIAGITAGHDRTETVGDPADGQFSVYCYRGEELIGAESVNTPLDHVRARRKLKNGPVAAESQQPETRLAA